MSKIDKRNVNTPLDKGDKIMLWYMEGESLKPGLKGVVTGSNDVMGNTHYQVDWENGSKLDLLSDADKWILVEKGDNNIQEGKAESMAELIKKRGGFLRNTNVSLLVEFLEKLRQCGVTNMLQATKYLVMGQSRMEIDFEYHRVSSEICDEVLEMADDVKDAVITGAIKTLEKENKKVTIENVERIIHSNIPSILQWFIITK